MPNIRPDAIAQRTYDLCVVYLRRPTGYATDEATGAPVLEFVPPLSAAEQTTFDALVLLARSQTGLSPTDYAAVRAQMQVLRDLRQLGRNAFVAQTQAQINRQLYDATIAITEIFLKLTRDS